MTALHHAAIENHVRIARLLLEHGADPTARTYPDAPPLDDQVMADISARDHSARHNRWQIVTLIDNALRERRPDTSQASGPLRACLKNGDRFSDLAERYLGDRSRWPEIYRFNNMQKEEKVRVGQCFLLPPV